MVDEKGEHHQHGQHHRQVFVAVAVVVFQVVPLIFQRVERLVLDLPTRSAAAHDGDNGVRGQRPIRDPTEVVHFADSLDFLDDPRGMDFPVFEDVDQHVGVRLVERHVVMETEMLQDAGGGIGHGQGLRLARRVGGVEVLEQESVVAGFDADDEMGVGFAQIAQMRGVGGEAVLDHDDGQVRMFLAKQLEPAAGGVAFVPARRDSSRRRRP